jgi:hypothetical protein
VLTAQSVDDDTVTIRTRPRMTAPRLTAPSEAEADLALPSTLPLEEVRIVSTTVPPSGGMSAGAPDGAAARMLSAVAAPGSDGFGNPTSEPKPTAPAAPVAIPRLRVLRGLKINTEYPIYEGQNLIGRRDDRPIDIDLYDQEPADRVWTSRLHAVLTLDNGVLILEDSNSLNGTFVNRHRVFPGQKRTLAANDVLQIGTVHLKVTY